MRTLAISLTLALSCSSCATIFSNGRDKISIGARDPATRIYVDGELKGTGQVDAVVKRGDVHVLRGELDGCEPVSVTTGKQLDPWVFGNILIGGVIGLIIDVASDNVMRVHPAQYDVSPTPAAARP